MGPRVVVDNSPFGDWEKQLHRNDKHVLRDCRENIITILENHEAWRGKLVADVFSKRIVTAAETPLGQPPGAQWTERDDVALARWLGATQGMLIRSLDTISTSVAYVAGSHEVHPVREFLSGLKHDGTARVDLWAVDHLGTPDSPYARLVSRWFLVNLIRRVMEPGCIMRSVVVLEGTQDLGKSTALRILADPWFSDTPFRIGDKDAYQQIQGVWLYEISELESFNRAESSAIKAFISSRDDSFRAPYERAPKKHPRQVAFAGSTNADEWLKDWTGNTRFWPLKVMQPVDQEALASVRDQLLAEAMVLYRARARAFPTPDEQRELFDPEQKQRMVSHPWEGPIAEWLRSLSVEYTTVQQVLEDCIKLKLDRVSPQGTESQRVGQILKGLGWQKRRGSASGSREWRWYAPAPEPHPEVQDDQVPF